MESEVSIPTAGSDESTALPESTNETAEKKSLEIAHENEETATTTPAVEETNTPMDSGTPGTLNGEGSEGSGTKKRNRNRDDLTLSPDLSKTGKRQRKINSMYTDFAMDKKTSQVIGQEQQPEGGPPSQPIVSPPPVIPVNKKEFIMTPQAAQEKARKLPKGYAFEPVAAPKLPMVEGPLPPKRERKKIALTDYVESPAAVPKGQKGAKAKDKGEKKDKKAAKRRSKKHQQVFDSVTAAQLKKQELENQLNVLTQQLAAVSQTLEHQTKSTPQTELLLGMTGEVKPTPRAKAKAKTKRSSIYDKFDSDEDAPIVKKAKTKQPKKDTLAKTKPSTTGRPQRIRKKSSAVENSEEETKDTSRLSGPLKQCHRILTQLMKHQYAFPFNVPVDPVALNIPDYFEIIKHPMDFGTILDNLEAADYNSVEEFAEDMRLVFKNAFSYNLAGTDVYVMATTLQDIFEKRISKLSPPLEVTAPPITPKPEEPNPMALVKEEMASTINGLKDSMKFVREEIIKLKRDKAGSAPAPAVQKTPKLPPKPKEDAREMLFEEKRNLSVNINNLPPENLGKVVQIIHQRMPNLAQNSPDEIEIDIDALDAGTLRALERYVKTCLARKKKKPVPNSKVAQAELASQTTSKSIDDVKKKLKELSSKSETLDKKGKKKKEGEENEDVDIEDDAPSRTYPSVIIEKDKESSSSSSSSSSSDSSESSSSASETESEKDKKAAKAAKAATESKVETQSEVKPAQERKDHSLPTSEAVETTNSTLPDAEAIVPKVNQEEKAVTLEQEPLQIVQPSAQKEVELKNLDAWKMEDTTDEIDSKPKAPDETWSQFQKADLQNKMREKERQEREEKERQEMVRKDQERRKQEELRLKQILEEEERKKVEEAEAKAVAQRELAEKRAAEKRAREQRTADVDMLGQSVVMSSFERDLHTGSFAEEGQEPILDMLKLKDAKQD